MPCQVRRSHDDYTVAWICAIPLEMAAATAMLDEVHQNLPIQSNDHNSYSLGRIWEHNVVIACLPSGKYGTVSASSVVAQLLSSFRSIRFGLMVGIGGGVPTSHADIRLGDIVVSKPTDTHGGVIEYDYGKVLSDGNLKRTGMLSRPPQILLTALSKLQAQHLNHSCHYLEFYNKLDRMIPGEASQYTRPLQEDRLYVSGYNHIDATNTSCVNCDPSKTVDRPPRSHTAPVVHYGLIASANQVVKNSNLRDKLGRDLGAHCVEMEAAGVVDNLSCIVVRGICDYADSHKNDAWQGYAAGMAAAYAKELLLSTAVVQKNREQIFEIPFDLAAASTGQNFVGREDELEQLWRHLRPSSRQSQKVTVVHALGGMGKTQLATHFARAHKDDFTAILWLNGKSRDTLLQSLSSVISRLPGQDEIGSAKTETDIKRHATLVLQWLALPENDSWLLIFDNVDQYSLDTDDGYDVEKFFPTADHGSILITSRLLKLSELGNSFPLQKLDSSHATQLLLQSTGLSHQYVEERDQDFISLIEHLDGLPLAITLAGAFIRETGTSISRYLRYYRESWHDLQSQSNCGRDYDHGNILHTWLVSYHEIEKRDPIAAELMLILAYFDNQDIWLDILQSAWIALHSPKWYFEVVHDELLFSEKMRILIGFSFVGVTLQSESYHMHPVVRDWCLYISERRDGVNPAIMREMVLMGVGDVMRLERYQKGWVLQQRLLPHASCVIARLRALPLYVPGSRLIDPVHRIAGLYTSQCRLKEAEEAYTLVLDLSKSVIGPDYRSHQDTLWIIYNLAHLYDTQGNLKAAEETFREALAGFKALEQHSYVAMFLRFILGDFYRRYNFMDKAEALFKEVRAYIHSGGRWSTVFFDQSTEGLGKIYMMRGQIAEAEPLFREALERRKIYIVGVEDDMRIFILSANLAGIYQWQGRTVEAEEMYRQSLVPERLLQSDSLDIIQHFHELALTYAWMGRLDSAERLFERAVSSYTKTVGADHIFTLRVFNGLGSFYAAQQRLAEAEHNFQQALSGFERLLGSEHWQTLDVLHRLRALQELQEFQKAQSSERAQTLQSPPIPHGPNKPEESQEVYAAQQLENDRKIEVPQKHARRGILSRILRRGQSR